MAKFEYETCTVQGVEIRLVRGGEKLLCLLLLNSSACPAWVLLSNVLHTLFPSPVVDNDLQPLQNVARIEVEVGQIRFGLQGNENVG